MFLIVKVLRRSCPTCLDIWKMRDVRTGDFMSHSELDKLVWHVYMPLVGSRMAFVYLPILAGEQTLARMMEHCTVTVQGTA